MNFVDGDTFCEVSNFFHKQLKLDQLDAAVGREYEEKLLS